MISVETVLKWVFYLGELLASLKKIKYKKS